MVITAQRKEHRITLPQHLRKRAQKRADELGYGSLLEYVAELVMVDTSPLIARSAVSLAQEQPVQTEPTITVHTGEWGTEV